MNSISCSIIVSQESMQCPEARWLAMMAAQPRTAALEPLLCGVQGLKRLVSRISWNWTLLRESKTNSGYHDELARSISRCKVPYEGITSHILLLLVLVASPKPMIRFVLMMTGLIK